MVIAPIEKRKRVGRETAPLIRIFLFKKAAKRGGSEGNFKRPRRVLTEVRRKLWEERRRKTGWKGLRP